MAFVLPAIAAVAAGVGSAASAVGTGIAGATTLAGVSGATATGLSTALAGTAASAPGWLGTAGIASNLLGGAVGAFGAYEQGQSAAASAQYNAAIERRNAAISRENAAIAGQAGAEQQFSAGLRARAEIGATKANQAAAGLDVNTGSAVDVRASEEELGQLDALTIRSNAAREAYGQQQQAVGHEAESTLDRFEAANDQTAGTLNAASTFLGSAGSAASNYYKYKLSGGLG